MKKNLVSIAAALAGLITVSFSTPGAFGSALAGQTILLPNTAPGAQGWSAFDPDGVANTVITPGPTAMRMDTWNQPDLGAAVLFYRSLGISSQTGFSIEFSLQVHRSRYDAFDGGVVFVPSFASGQHLLVEERNAMIVWAEDRITWGDLSQAYLMNTTNAFHTYRLDVLNGFGSLYVDDALALQRAFPNTTGTVAFGDQSNDFLNGNVATPIQGDFALGYITYVPEPSTIALFLPGLFAMLWKTRCRTFGGVARRK